MCMIKRRYSHCSLLTVDEAEDEVTREIVIEEQEETQESFFDLPEMEESVVDEEKPPNQANIVAAFWQLFMTVFFFHFWEGNDKKLTNAPTNENKASAKKQA